MTKRHSRQIGIWLGVSVFFALLTLAYLWPAPLEIAAGRTLGPAHDDTTMPYHAWWVRELVTRAPFTLLNGSLYTPQIGAPAGANLWIPYVERLSALLSWPFFSAEASGTFFIIFLHVLAGTLTTWLGRRMNLSWWLSVGMGVCIAFTPFTHWRSREHPSLAGVYFTPLLILGWDFLSRSKKQIHFAWAALLFLLVLTTAHYLILMSFPLMVLIFAWIFFEHKNQKSRKYLVFAFIPFAIGLLWIRLSTPIPFPESEISTAAPRKLGQTIAIDRQRRRWDVGVYSARPLDYLTSNYGNAYFDPNPIRGALTRWIRDTDTNWYPQERSSGIRWFILIAVILGLAYRKQLPQSTRRRVVFGALFAFIAYVFSLHPRCIAPFGVGVCPSKFFHELIPEMRAPNRWSTCVNMGLVVSAFAFLSWWIQQKFKLPSHRKIAEGAVFALALLEFPPLWYFPTHQSVESFIPQTKCGLGVDLPYEWNDNHSTYRSIVALRRTDCRMLNDQRDPFITKEFHRLLSREALKSPAAAQGFLSCLGTQWVRLSQDLDPNLCSQLGFARREGRYCRDPLKKSPPSAEWLQCVR